MKVVLLHFEFLDYTVSLANALTEYADVTLIQPKRLADICASVVDPRLKRKTFEKPRLRSLKNIPTMRDLRRLIQYEKPDVIHVQLNGEFWLNLSLLFNDLPPLVLTVHDITKHPGDNLSYRVPGSRTIEHALLHRAQQIVMHTLIQKRYVTDNLRIPAERVQVVPLGELGTIHKRWAKPQEMAVSPEPYTLLFFGRIWPYKGLRYLIEAMPTIIERFPQIKLIIAGTGENLTNYFPNGIDSQHYEIINRFIPHAEVVRLFRRSTITVQPYIEASQSAVTTIAYGLGVPVIASRIGGLSELIHDGEDGLLVPPGDVPALTEAIIQLLVNPELQSHLRKAALVRSQTDLSWSTIALQTLATYQRATQVDTHN